MIKNQIKKYLPKRIEWTLRLLQQKKRSNATYAKAEKEVNKSFKASFNKNIDWNNPKTYNEKIKISALYGASKIKAELTDKVKVRDWVKKRDKSGECKLIPLLGVYDTIDEIDFEKLPNKFVIKMNNDSGSVFIHDEKHPITKKVISEYKNYYQKRKFAFNNYELHYQFIKPKIMVEKYMGDSIRDYKFMCFNGKVALCWVDFDRFNGHKRNFYDKDWDSLSIKKAGYKHYPDEIKKPKNYKKMWELAEKFSKGFDQVRVDFYEIGDVVYFGEMTFTDGNGSERFDPPRVDEKLGALWKLDMKAIRARRKKILESKARVCDDVA